MVSSDLPLIMIGLRGNLDRDCVGKLEKEDCAIQLVSQPTGLRMRIRDLIWMLIPSHAKKAPWKGGNRDPNLLK